MAIENQIPSSPPVSQALLAWAEYWHPIAWKCLMIAGAVTALGACVTIAFLILQWRTTSIRETQAEWRLSVLEHKVAEAKDEAADERERIAALNVEATNERDHITALNVEAAALTRKNSSLEEMTHPRRLSPAQINDVTAAWKAYAGHSVTLWSYGMDLEGSALSEQIKDCLTGARVVVVNNIGRVTSSMPAHVGIQIAGVDKRLVGAIYAGIHTIGGLEATEIDLPDGGGAEAVPAEIFVGMKPLEQLN
jgi:hypothetical protein